MTAIQTVQYSAAASAAEENAYLTAQLAVDAVVRAPERDRKVTGRGPDGRTEWTLFAQGWWRASCSGSWSLVRPFMREHLEFHRDPSLTLTDCTAHMQAVLKRLQQLDDTDLAAAVEAMYDIRDTALERARADRGQAEAGRVDDGPVWSADAPTLAVEVQARQTALDALREGLPVLPWWQPSGPTDRFLRLGMDYGVYLRTGLVRQLDGEEGENAAKTTANPPLSAEQALEGLDRVLQEIAEMTARRRSIAFAAIDWAWRNAQPLDA